MEESIKEVILSVKIEWVIKSTYSHMIDNSFISTPLLPTRYMVRFGGV